MMISSLTVYSLIPAAYYADLACYRGRFYLNDFLNLGGESSTTSREKRSRKEIKEDNYEQAVRVWDNGIHPSLRESMFYI
jgi:eukaryotic translation initiation factor 2C